MYNILLEYVEYILEKKETKNKVLYVFGFVDSLYNYKKDRWNESVIQDIKKATSDPDGITVLCTARSKEQVLVNKTMSRLKSRNITFDYYYFRGKEIQGTTAKYKMNVVKKILDQNEGINKIYFWDDREDVLNAVSYISGSAKYIPIKVKI